jgi:hypothetical protein
MQIIAQILNKLEDIPSGNTALILRYEVVSRIIDALSNWLVIAAGNGSNLANSRNSAFSFSLRDRAAFFDFSFIIKE